LSPDLLTDTALEHIRKLNELAQARGQSLAQMAIAWTLRDSRVTSALIGASSLRQLDENLDALDAPPFTEVELAAIDAHAVEAGINLWAGSSAVT
jgi:L-glyceraldehyde 3-phosphate reductase